MSTPFEHVDSLTPAQWAIDTFGLCDFGNIARTKSVIRFAEAQAKRPSGSVDAACGRDSAAAEGSHRMIRNKHIRPAALSDGACLATWQRAATRRVVLGLEDSTGQSFEHSVAAQLGNQNNSESPSRRGWMAHSVLVVDGDTFEPLGLGYQDWWCRKDGRPAKGAHKKRSYPEKESFKWQRASERMAEMADLSNVISVCDREADIALYLHYKQLNQQRFVVRSGQSRSLLAAEGTLHEFMEHAEVRGAASFEIPQSHGVARRSCTVTVQFERVALTCLKDLPDQTVTVVRIAEYDPKTKKPLEWILLTSEPVFDVEDALRVVTIYKQRWLIEVFHTAWKTGCNAKGRRQQEADNLLRVLIVLGHLAVLLLRFQHLAAVAPDEPCDTILTKDEWECLHATAKPDAPIPQRAPGCRWAFEEMAKGAGWRNSKGTGAIGFTTLWNGWIILQNNVAGWRAARRRFEQENLITR